MNHPSLQTIKSLALAIGILIVLNLFFNIGVRTFYPPLKFETFCPEELQHKYENQAACEEVGGKWIEQVYGEKYVEQSAPLPVSMPVDRNFQSYCDPFHTCNKTYNTAHEVYERNVFIVLVIAGFIALGIGLQMNAVLAISSGFVWGGVLSLLIGTIRYWSGMQDYLRFVILGIVLVVLIFLGYRKMKK